MRFKYMLTNHRQIPIREKILGLYYNDFQTDAPCTDSQIPALAIENSLFSSPVEKVGLAPDIVEAIVEGRQPRSLTVKRLLQGIPCAWADQR
ncbi:MAG: hypothetical protein WAL40_09545, partial [Rhodoplanes sp.]